MSLRSAALWAALAAAAAACQPAAPVETGYAFAVESASPSDGGEPVTQTSVVELFFNLPADPLACTADTIRLDALTRDTTGTDHTVDFVVESTLSWVAEDNVQLVRAEPLPRGWTYAITARGGADGCVSTEDAEMAGFYQSFLVP